MIDEMTTTGFDNRCVCMLRDDDEQKRTRITGARGYAKPNPLIKVKGGSGIAHTPDEQQTPARAHIKKPVRWCAQRIGSPPFGPRTLFLEPQRHRSHNGSEPVTLLQDETTRQRAAGACILGFAF